jgi:GNAT superfamily N-acetyltransferase
MEIVTLAERPDLAEAMWDLGSVWPEFMKQDPIADVYYAEVEGRWSGHTLLAIDGDAVAARAFCVPFAVGEAIGRAVLPATGWDGIIRWAHLDVLAGRTPTTLGGLEVAIAPDHRGTGLAGRMLRAMRDVARRDGLDRVVLPVRPSRKHEHPELSMAEYVDRRRADGLPEDPWLRVHVRIGGRIGSVCPLSMMIGGTPDQWRRWTGLPFDTDGRVVVPGALAPVLVDLAADTVVYVEPNVWVEHPARPG